MDMGFWIDAVNGHNKKVRVWQPNIRAAEITADRLTDEKMTNVEIRRRNLGDS